MTSCFIVLFFLPGFRLFRLKSLQEASAGYYQTLDDLLPVGWYIDQGHDIADHTQDQ